MSLDSIAELSRLQLASVAAQAGLCLTWSETPEDMFSHGEAHMKCECFVLHVELDKKKMSHAMRKCVFGSLRPGKTQTDLLSYRDQLDSWNFEYLN